MASLGRAHQRDQMVVLETDLLTRVEVEVGHVERDPRAGPALGVVERVIRGDQAAIDGVPQMRQIQAAE